MLFESFYLDRTSVEGFSRAVGAATLLVEMGLSSFILLNFRNYNKKLQKE
jgi:hypothetical protein